MSIGTTPAPPAAVPASMVRARYGGLDGLRAIAVGLVLIYHLFPGLLRGGFLGVDVFFAISGFLITSLLLSEWAATGAIRLVDFWRRRARRLLPALALVLLTVTATALLVGGDVLVGIGRQIAGAALFVSNWTSVAAGADYFAKDAPELFRNTWSLGIEEQFYLVLPLVALLLFRVGGAAGKVARPIIFGALGVASATLMVVWSLNGIDPSRLYFGSDTHSFGLFLGAALACVLHRGVNEGRLPEHTGRQWPLTLTAALGLATIVVLSLTLREGSPESFRGGIQLATIASLAVIWAITRPGAEVGTRLDTRTMRWIGERSYGIYLWHWPLLLLAQAVWGSGEQWSMTWILTGLGVLAATLLISQLSYRYVEQPVRRLGLRRSLRRLAHLGRGNPRQRAVALTLSVVVLAALPMSVAAVALAPRVTSAEDAIERGRAMLDSAEQAGPEDGTSDAPAGTGLPQDPAAAEAEADGADDTAVELDLTPILPSGAQLTAIGDSVMLASSPELIERFPGISIDAEVSRGLPVGVGLAAAQASGGTLRYALVVGLGTNGPISATDLDELRAIAGTRPLILLSAHAERDWIPGVNQMLADYAAAQRGVVLAEWDAAISPHPEMLAGDGIHPEPSGGQIYASVIADALAELNTPAEQQGYRGPRR